jgi:formate dehydrogenase major subunit
VAGLATTFGSGAMTNSFADFDRAKMFFIIGSNMTHAHPVAASFVKNAVMNGAELVLVDPRATELAPFASMHLQLKVGSDIALLNGIMHVLIEEDLYDKGYVNSCTVGFAELAAKVREYPPERAEKISGVPAERIRAVARRLAAVKPAMLMYTLGITEHTCGVNNVLSCANLQMLLGNVGFECGGVNPLRGQNNVQGACDMGALPNRLPRLPEGGGPGRAREVREGLGREAPRQERAYDAGYAGRAGRRQGAGLLRLRREPGQQRAGHTPRGALPGLGRVHGVQRHLPHRDHALRPRGAAGGGLERGRRHLHQQRAPGTAGAKGGGPAGRR